MSVMFLPRETILWRPGISVESAVGDPEARELHFLRTELELFGVEDDAAAARDLKKVDDAPPVLLEVFVPEDGVVDAPLHVLKVLDYCVKSPVVPVARPHEALWVP